MQISIFNKQTAELNNIRKLDISQLKFRNVDRVRPFLRYPGSKYNAAKYIEPFWKNIEFNEYREPFLGSGAIFFKMPKVEFSWLNDIDGELVNVFKVVANKRLRDKLLQKIDGITPTKEFFEKLKNWQPEKNIDKAYRYFVINRTAYSGIMNLPNWGFHPIKSVQPNKWAERIIQAGEKLESSVYISKMSYSDIINAPSPRMVWLFVDPPYFKADQKRAYSHSFDYQDHINLLKILKSTNICFVLHMIIAKK